MSLPNEAPRDDQELSLRLARVSEHLRADRLEQAATEIDAVLARWPREVRARNLLGLLHFRAGRLAEARAVYAELLDAHGDDPALRLNLGLVELRMGSYGEAVRHLSWVAEAEPDNARAQGYYGLALLRAGDVARARQVLARAGQDELVRQLDRQLGTAPRAALERADGGAVSPEAEGPVATPVSQELSGEDNPNGEPAARASREECLPSGGLDAGPMPDPGARRDEATRTGAAGEPGPPAWEAPRHGPGQAVAEGRRAILAGTQALDAERPLAAADPTAGAGVHDEQVRSPGQGLPPPSSRSPLRPIPVPERRTLPPGTPLPAQGPQPLMQFLRDRELAPPTDGNTFGITADGLLVVRIDGHLPTRSIGVVVSTGELNFEPVARRARGRSLAETFGTGPTGLFRATGRGLMVISPRGGHFVALSLTDEAVYLRESATFAFEERLYWENGRIPGSSPRPGHRGLPDELARVAQFRGTGQVVLRTERPPWTVRLPGGQPSFIEVEQLLGWTGRIIPSLLLGEEGAPTPYVECTGEGFLLVEPPPREGNPPSLAPEPVVSR